ncbi:DUF7144 family membrane protein [Nocardia arthritidis]|uniref:DUF7144 domain-containing protein n=1 Tax=Nocardia arthritidis TaxID=228602 RepID=A0A6G9YNP4_9NOCA|nr:hypothetical protein [Nocardia arthritidis]QIS14816.1 hypothetical protein F5544_34915 [Nocardia arthritidis]QIS14822.1 hypothetical protein F5544_34945 [Nocardia arthritidis]
MTSPGPVRTGPVLNDMTIFAGVLILITGILHLLTAIAAIAKRDIFVVTEDQVFLLNVSTWGWVHLVIAVLVIVAGVGIVTGKSWGYLAGIVMAAVSILDNFVFAPIYPFWALVMIAIDILVIWALARQIAAE